MAWEPLAWQKGHLPSSAPEYPVSSDWLSLQCEGHFTKAWVE